jgi:hypothetical protein
LRSTNKTQAAILQEKLKIIESLKKENNSLKLVPNKEIEIINLQNELDKYKKANFELQ